MILPQIFLILQIWFIAKSNALKLSISDEGSIPVFQPFPSTIINPLQLCPQGFTSSISQFQNFDKSFVAVSLTSCGLFIYDITDLSNPSLVFRDQLNPTGKTLGIRTSHKNNYLWAGHSSGEFYGIDISQLPFKIIIKSKSNQNLLISKIKPWDDNNDIIFLMCATQFQIFDWRNKEESPKYLQSVNVNAVTSKSIEFVRDNQYAIVNAPNKGVQFYLVSKGNDIDNIGFTYSCVLKPYFFDVSDFKFIDDNTIAILMIYRGVFLYNVQEYFDNQGKSCTSTSFKFIAKTKYEGLSGGLYLSKEKRYLYVQYRVIGVKVYDLKLLSFQIVQEIKIEKNSKDLTLNKEEDLLFYTNSVSLLIFQRTQPNFNRNIPNLLLNTYQTTSANWFKEPSEGSVDYECLWREDLNQLFISRANYGVQLLKYSGNGILEDTSAVYLVNNPYPISQIKFIGDGVTAYFVRNIKGFTIVDYSNEKSPVILKENVTLGASFVNFFYLEFFKNYTIGVVTNTINIIIFSLKDPLNPVLISQLDTYKYTFGDSTLGRVLVNKDETMAYFSMSLYGIIIADIADIYQPKLISKLFTDGAAEIKLTSDEKYLIICANYQGVFIGQLDQDKQIIIVSKVSVVGNLFRGIVLPNDQYIIATSYENPAVSLIDISDVKNPQVIQIFGKKTDFAFFFMCISSDLTQIFVTNQYKLYLLQLQNQIILHSQVYQLISQENSNEYERIALQKGQSLTIGQKIEIHLVPIYQSNQISVRKAYYYQEHVLQDLPAWMTFFPSEQILRLDISKDSLKKNDNGLYIETVQQVVFLTYQQMLDNVFLNTYLDITVDDSKNIFSTCKKEGLIDSEGFILDSYTPQQELSFGANENVYLAKWSGNKLNLVKQFIKYTLNQNIINYTTQFTISQSLYIDLQNKNKVIQTQQNDITVQMTIYEILPDGQMVQSNKGQFVKKNYSGVLVLLSDKQDEIKLEGSLKNTNQILSDGIKYAYSEKQITADLLRIQLIVSDKVNYNYDRTFRYNEFPFLSRQSPIIVSEQFTLQNDLYQKCPNGDIYIQENFQYQISSNVFSSNDEKNLQFSAKMLIDGQFLDIPKDFWIQFSSNDKVFTGTPLASNYNEKVIIQVNATDGYSYTLDTFQVTPSKIPFSYAIQFAIQILGPMFGLLGFYKYKHLMYNLAFKEQYLYTKDVVYIGEVYRKQITITENYREMAIKLFNFFLNIVGEDFLRKQMFSQPAKSLFTSSYDFYQPQTEQNKQNKEQQILIEEDLNFEDQVMKKIYKFGINTEEICFLDKKTQNIVLQSSSKLVDFDSSINCITDFKMLSPTSNDNRQNQLVDEIKEFPPVDKPKDILKLNKKIEGRKQINIKNTAEIIKQAQPINESSFRLYNLQSNTQKEHKSQNQQKTIKPLIIFDQNGRINVNQILKFIIDEQQLILEKKRILAMKDIKNLQNPTSILSKAIICLLVEHLLNLDKVSKSIYDLMHQKALIYYKKIDWYKAYTNIKPQFEEVHTNPFPEIIINEQTSKAALYEIFKALKNYYYEPLSKAPLEIKFSFILIQENLKAKALGFSSISPSFLQVSQGESIHSFSHTIRSLKAFERNLDIPCCLNLYKKLDLHYQQKGLTDNEKLPSWIHSIDLINGTILLSGIPEKKDIGSIFFKVVDQNQFILRSYEIQVLQKLCDQPVNQRNKENKLAEYQSSLQCEDKNNNSNYNMLNIKYQRFSSYAQQNENKNTNIESLLIKDKYNKTLNSVINYKQQIASKDVSVPTQITQEAPLEKYPQVFNFTMSNLGQEQSNKINFEYKPKQQSNLELQTIQSDQIVECFVKSPKIRLDKPQGKPQQLDDTLESEISYQISQSGGQVKSGYNNNNNLNSGDILSQENYKSKE